MDSAGAVLRSDEVGRLLSIAIRMRWTGTRNAVLIGLALAWMGSFRCLLAEPLVFSRDILPILSDHCFACHGPDEGSRKAGLRLDTREGALGMGRSGQVAVVPGDPDGSALWRRINHADPDEVMPPVKSNRVLLPDQVARIRRWIEEGAVWGRHWAFELPTKPAVPAIPVPGGNPIDAFVRARLDREGLKASPEASWTTLIRRVSLDLTGLPPSAEALALPAGTDPDEAYRAYVDQLLASPRYGERMAWDWLEAARYADSNGYQGDGERTMWPWRDWVVDAFNRNLPFDRFTVWQIAGDRLPEATEEQRLATGFLRNHMINGEGGRIPEENRIDYLFDQTETVATVWLGATFNCTRCHDHKYDPFTQRDYFSLLAYFNRTPVDGSGGNPQTPPVLEVPSEKQRHRRIEAEERLKARIRATREMEANKFSRADGVELKDAPAAEGLSAEILGHLAVAPGERDGARLEALSKFWKEKDPEHARVLEEQRRARDERDAAVRAIPRVMVMEDVPKARPTFVLSRGNYLKPGLEVGLSLPGSLIGPGTEAGTDRLGLAQWLVSAENPLTARVTVNRFWQMFLGVGLVKTSEDFGVQGERPSHPELLDWLAMDFVENGWDVKHLVRRIVTSRTYRQSSRVDADQFERDPENRLLARGSRFRMPSWMIRDVALAAAGMLGSEIGGTPVRPYQPSGVWEEATFGNKRYEQDHGAALYRRSLMVFWRRIVGPTLFFDVANRQTCSVKTPRTNVPLHALLTLNDVTYVEAARVLAEAAIRKGGVDFEERLGWVYRRVLGREPGEREKRILMRGLEGHRIRYTGDVGAARALLGIGEWRSEDGLDPVEHAAWTMVCSTVLNLDEALTRE